MVYAGEEVPDVRLQDPALRIVPFLSGPVGEPRRPPGGFVVALALQVVVPHLVFQVGQSEVHTLPDLGSIVALDEAPGDGVIEYVVDQGVLDHFVDEGGGLYQPPLWLEYLEGFKLARMVGSGEKQTDKALRTGQGLGLILGGPGLASLSLSGGQVGVI